MKKKWLEDLIGWKNFEYLILKGVPVRRAKEGYVIDMKEDVLECMVARAMVESKVPISGAEVKFLRAVLGLSLNKFGGKLGMTGVTVLHWEQAPGKRLLVVNELAVRALCAQELGVPISGWLNSMLGKDNGKIEILVKSPKRLRRVKPPRDSISGAALAMNSPVKRANTREDDFVPAWAVRQRAKRKRQRVTNGKTVPQDLSDKDILS